MTEDPLKIVTPNNVAQQGGVVFWDGGKAIAQTPIIGGSAAIVRVGGVNYAYGEHGAERRSRRQISLFRSRPAIAPALEQQRVNVRVAILFRKREGDNWQYYVGGLASEPIFIASVPIVKAVHSINLSTSLNRFDSATTDEVIENNIQSAGISLGLGTNILEESANPFDASLSLTYNWSATTNNGSFITGTGGWTFRAYDSDPSNIFSPLFTTHNSIPSDRYAGKTISDELPQLQNSVTFEKTVSVNWLDLYEDTFRAWVGFGSASIGVNEVGFRLDLDVSGTITGTINELNSNDGWISPNGQGGFVVGVRYDLDLGSRTFNNVSTYTVSSNGTVTEGTTGDDYQSYKTSSAISFTPSGLNDRVTGLDFFSAYPSINSSVEGLPGYSGSDYDLDFSDPESWNELSFIPAFQTYSANDSTVAIIDPDGLVGISLGSQRTITVYVYNVSLGGEYVLADEVSLLISGWEELSPDSYKRLENTSNDDVNYFPKSSNVQGDLVMGTAIALP